MEELMFSLLARTKGSHRCEAGYGRVSNDSERSEDELIEEEGFRSDGYGDADAREEMIELENDTIDTLVNDSQDASTEGIDNGGWNHDD